MSTELNSFDASRLGTFTRSPLGARNNSSNIMPLAITFIDSAGGTYVDGNGFPIQPLWAQHYNRLARTPARMGLLAVGWVIGKDGDFHVRIFPDGPGPAIQRIVIHQMPGVPPFSFSYDDLSRKIADRAQLDGISFSRIAITINTSQTLSHSYLQPRFDEWVENNLGGLRNPATMPLEIVDFLGREWLRRLLDSVGAPP
jgi:hypothetical protein